MIEMRAGSKGMAHCSELASWQVGKGKGDKEKEKEKGRGKERLRALLLLDC